jgi:hypothetical protein
MFGGMAFKIGMLAKKSAEGVDVTPNAVDWSEVIYDSLFGDFTYTEKQITGINTSITLHVEYDQGLYDLYYKVNNTDQGYEGSPTASDPVTLGFTLINHTGTFSVSNNQYVSFGLSNPDNSNFLDTVSVYNDSDSGTLLDTFDAKQINYS